MTPASSRPAEPLARSRVQPIVKILFAVLLLSLSTSSVLAADSRLLRPGSAETVQVAPWEGVSLASARLLPEDSGTGSTGDLGPSPALAGLMSAVVPGSGQLSQGKNRGWIYLGVEIASWFSMLALNDASDQALADSRGFADSHWDSTRYSTGSCWNEEDSGILFDYRSSDSDAYYSAIGDQDTYVCGWEQVDFRTEYNDLRSDANGLSDFSSVFVAVIVLNHLVSAIDAAKVASDRRKEREQAFDLRVSPPLSGELYAQLRLTRRF
jgi:hypothetical protein